MGAHNTFKRTSMNQMIFFFNDIKIHGVIHTTADFFQQRSSTIRLERRKTRSKPNAVCLAELRIFCINC